MPLPLTQPSNCKDRVLQYVDAIAVGMGGVSAYQPQSAIGDPNGVNISRWSRDLAIDVVNHRLYYALAADSQEWAIAPVPAPGAPVLPPNFAAIANPSFESPDLGGATYNFSVADWIVPYPEGGVQRLGGGTGLTVPDGNQVMHVGEWAEQTLADVLLVGNYVLKVWALSRVDYPSSGYWVKLLAGAGLIINHSAVLTPGESVELTLSATVPSGHANLGQALKIRMESIGQTSFDHVRLWTP